VFSEKNYTTESDLRDGERILCYVKKSYGIVMKKDLTIRTSIIGQN
jgi:hypothetical protein